MQLLPGEQNLATSNRDKLVLTSRRILLTDKQWGRSYKITIFLENISSIENLYKSNPIYLVTMALAVFVGGAMAGSSHERNLAFGPFIAAAVFILFWLNSRRHVVTISSDGGGKLNFSVEGMSEAAVQDLIDKVGAAKAARMDQLFNR